MKPNQLIGIVAFSVFLLFGCSKQETTSPPLSTFSSREISAETMQWSEIIDKYKVESQEFRIDPGRDTLLKCSKGTRVVIPANVLCRKDGSAVTKGVKIIVKECYGMDDFLGENLSTVCSNRLLESGGTVEIKAKCGSEELTLVSGGEYGIAFPKEVQRKGMEVFYGDRNKNGVMEWKQETPVVKVVDTTTSSRSTESTVEFKGALVIPTYIVPRRIDKYIKWKKEDGKVEDLRDHFRDNFKPSEEWLSYMGNMAGWTLPVLFDVDLKTGKLQNFLIDRPSFPKKLRIELLVYLQSLPAIDLSIVGPYEYYSRDREGCFAPLNQVGSAKRNERYSMSITWIDTNIQAREEQNYRDRVESALEKGNIVNAAYYILTSKQFGWINCDRFLNYSPDVLVDLVIKTETPTANVRLVFNDIKSVMTGVASSNNTVSFQRIPRGSAVTMIYLDPEGTSPKMKIEEFIVEEAERSVSQTKKFVFAEFERQLDDLVKSRAEESVVW